MRKWNSYLYFQMIGISIFFASKMLAQGDHSMRFDLNDNLSSTYEECLKFYKALDQKHKELRMVTIGKSDSDEPLHLVILDRDGLKNPAEIRKKKRSIVLVNNGIHPGEPDGIDASMLLVRDWLKDKKYRAFLDSVSVIFIPVYNIGGAKFRNRNTRANQNGPEEYGFRGNRQYLDLNRDFIKCDSRNSISFVRMFQYWNPDVFIETHTSDGADYPYVNTLLPSQKDKLNPEISSLLFGKMIPDVSEEMSKLGDPLVPYVHVDRDPAQGIYGFMDSPRYSSGYSALFNAIPMLIETHMLKPYRARVESTRRLLEICIQWVSERPSEIRSCRERAFDSDMLTQEFSTRWIPDTTRCDSIDFNGYEIDSVYYPLLDLSLYAFRQDRMYKKKIPYYAYFRSELKLARPQYYCIPQAYSSLINRLKWNGIRMERLMRDSLIYAEYDSIIDYRSPKNPYENHYLHSDVKVKKKQMSYLYLKGDYLIPTHQKNVRFLMEVLETQSTDSYFAWNFFDGVLQRKEYYSDYLFAATAEKLLKNQPQLLREFQEKVQNDPAFAGSNTQKLEFIYSKSPWAEPFYRIIPVARIFSK